VPYFLYKVDWKPSALYNYQFRTVVLLKNCSGIISLCTVWLCSKKHAYLIYRIKYNYCYNFSRTVVVRRVVCTGSESGLNRFGQWTKQVRRVVCTGSVSGLNRFGEWSVQVRRVIWTGSESGLYRSGERSGQVQRADCTGPEGELNRFGEWCEQLRRLVWTGSESGLYRFREWFNRFGEWSVQVQRMDFSFILILLQKRF